MKKIIAICLALVLTLGLCACNKGASDDKTIKIGASVTPHAEILKVIEPILAEQGYTLQIIEFTDYVQPNLQLESGDLLANYFQHQPYLTDFNNENGTHIVSAAAVHYEPFGIYPGKTSTLDELTDGMKIAIPNDGTNEARALMLLEQEGIIKLKEDTGFTATKLDIEEYNYDIEILEIEAAQLARSLEDVNFAVINGNYAIQAGLSVGKDAIATEDKDSAAAETYANIIAIKEGSEEDPRIKALVEAVLSEQVKTFIDETYDGSVIAKF